MNQHHESVSLTAGIFLIDKEIMDQLWSIGDEMFKVPIKRRKIIISCLSFTQKHVERKGNKVIVPIDGVDGQDSVTAHIAVTVLQAGSDGWHEGLEQLGLLQLAQKTQSGATDELIGMLEILKWKDKHETNSFTVIHHRKVFSLPFRFVHLTISSHFTSVTAAYLSVGVTDQDHLLKQLAVWSCFGDNLPENQQQLLDRVILKRQHEADDGHQEPWQLLTVQDHDDDLLQSFSLCLDLPLFYRKTI